MLAQCHHKTAEASQGFRSRQLNAIKTPSSNGRRRRNGTLASAYGPAADYAAKIQTGDHVFLEGELTYREYERTVETESGPVKVPWPVTEIVIETLSVIDRKRKQDERGAA